MRKELKVFNIIWLGQSLSLLGSKMSLFALGIWIWQLTGNATDLALFGFFAQVPQIFMLFISGTIVDRWNRKLLIIAADCVIGVLTIMLLILYSTNHLQILHLYLSLAIMGFFNL